MKADTNLEEEIDWDNIIDKRTRGIYLINGVLSSTEQIRRKIFQVQDIELLESLKTSFGHISQIYRNYASQYSKTETVNYLEGGTRINPNLIEQRRMEVHTLCCELQLFCKRVRPFIKETMIDRAIGQFFNIMNASGRYFEKIVMDNQIFHAQLPGVPKKSRKITKFY